MFRPLMFDAVQLPDPSMDEERSLTELDKLLSQQSDEFAAIIIEPLIMGAGICLTSANILQTRLNNWPNTMVCI